MCDGAKSELLRGIVDVSYDEKAPFCENLGYTIEDNLEKFVEEIKENYGIILEPYRMEDMGEKFKFDRRIDYYLYEDEQPLKKNNIARGKGKIIEVFFRPSEKVFYKKYIEGCTCGFQFIGYSDREKAMRRANFLSEPCGMPYGIPYVHYDLFDRRNVLPCEFSLTSKEDFRSISVRDGIPFAFYVSFESVLQYREGYFGRPAQIEESHSTEIRLSLFGFNLAPIVYDSWDDDEYLIEEMIKDTDLEHPFSVDQDDEAVDGILDKIASSFPYESGPREKILKKIINYIACSLGSPDRDLLPREISYYKDAAVESEFIWVFGFIAL